MDTILFEVYFKKSAKGKLLQKDFNNLYDVVFFLLGFKDCFCNCRIVEKNKETNKISSREIDITNLYYSYHFKINDSITQYLKVENI